MGEYILYCCLAYERSAKLCRCHGLSLFVSEKSILALLIVVREEAENELGSLNMTPRCLV